MTPLAEWVSAQQDRNLSPATIRQRQIHLARWVRWCGDPLEPQLAGETAMRAYLAAHPMKVKSRAVVVSHLHAFYVWAQLRELVGHDPTLRLERPRFDRGEPRPIERDDLAFAMQVAPPRLRLMLGLGAGAGLRCCEIAGLQWANVAPAERCLHLTVTKGSRARTVPYGDELAELLEGTARVGTWVLPHAQRPLDPISAERVSQLIARHLRACGVDATAHQLRHRFATVALEHSDDLLAVAEILGHRSVTTTQIYARVAARRGRAVVAAMPRMW